MRTSTRIVSIATLLGSALLLGCAQRGPAPAPTSAPSGAAASAPAGGGEAAEWAREGTAPPADSKLAQVKAGMRPREVEQILGPPDDENAYITGKMFIPWYFGRDRSRQAYFYKGVGRVVFQGAGGFGQNYTVRFVDYDPSEDGIAR